MTRLVKVYFKKLVITCIVVLLFLSLNNNIVANSVSDNGLPALTVGQALNSAFIAAESAYLLNLYYRQVVGLSMVMFSSGIILPNLLTKKQNLSGHRATYINSMSFWSATNGVLLGMAVDQSTTSQAALGISFDLISTGYSFYDEKYLSNHGQALVHSGAIWGSISAFGLGMVVDSDLRDFPKYIWAGQSLGLVSGYLLSQENQLSEEQTFRINLYMLGAGLFSYSSLTLFHLNPQIKWAVSLVSSLTTGVLLYINEKGKEKLSSSILDDSAQEKSMYINIPSLHF